jgi:hypothetical protein
MQNEPDHPLEFLEHELNSLHMLLNVWHAEIPSPLREGLWRYVRSMERELEKLRFSYEQEMALPAAGKWRG